MEEHTTNRESSSRPEVLMHLRTDVVARQYLAEWLKEIMHNQRNYMLRTGKYHSNDELIDKAIVEVDKLLR